ncbi:S9 family peptidase, partial [Streptomyces sp. DJ]
MMTEQLSFPRQYARTQRFTLGAPRSFTVSPDGARTLFLRSSSGTDRAGALWVLDTDSGGERIAADPAVLLGGAEEELSEEERARRERSREGGAGIVGYAVDAAVELAAFPLSGRLFTAELRAGTARELDVPGPVLDPRPSPDGRHVAYVADGALRVVGADGDGDRALAEPEAEGVTWGLAEFVAAEEMQRSRGYWWSPRSDRLLAARADDSPVRRWWIADPAEPGREPAEVAYPAAGTPNAEVRLFVLGLDGSRTEVEWDRASHPYLARVHWSAGGPPVLQVQSRDQRSQMVLAADPDTGRTTPLHAEEDPDWLELFPGVPAWTPDGRLVRIEDKAGVRSLVVGDRPRTGAQLHVQAVLDVGEEDVLVSASAGPEGPDDETGQVHVYRVDGYGAERVSDGPGVHSAVRSGDVTVLSSSSPERSGALVRVLRGGRQVAQIASHAARPVLT